LSLYNSSTNESVLLSDVHFKQYCQYFLLFFSTQIIVSTKGMERTMCHN